MTAYANTWALGALKPGRDRQVRLGRDRGQGRHARRPLPDRRRAERQGEGARRRRAPDGTFASTLEARRTVVRQRQRSDRPARSARRVLAVQPPSERAGRLPTRESAGARSTHAVPQRLTRCSSVLPDVDPAVDRVAVDLGELIRRRSSSVVERGDVLLELPTLLAPSSAEVTRGSRSTQAIASCASVCPRRCGDLVERRARARGSRRVISSSEK